MVQQLFTKQPSERYGGSSPSPSVNFKVGDVVEIIDHAMFPKGKQFTIKNIRKCISDPNHSCYPCPGLIEFVEVAGRSHCFGYNEGKEDRYLCKLADFNLELPL